MGSLNKRKGGAGSERILERPVGKDPGGLWGSNGSVLYHFCDLFKPHFPGGRSSGQEKPEKNEGNIRRSGAV